MRADDYERKINYDWPNDYKIITHGNLVIFDIKKEFMILRFIHEQNNDKRCIGSKLLRICISWSKIGRRPWRLKKLKKT